MLPVMIYNLPANYALNGRRSPPLQFVAATERLFPLSPYKLEQAEIARGQVFRVALLPSNRKHAQNDAGNRMERREGGYT